MLMPNLNYTLLVNAYRNARIAWAKMPLVREAAETLGMNERAYADAYVRERETVTTTTTASTNGVIPASPEALYEAFDRAYADAGPAGRGGQA